MFGYVRTCKPELRVKEFEFYKAVYCTLCRQLGRKYGILSRLTLSYDFTFLALLRLSFRPTFAGLERRACAFCPVKKCNYCRDPDGDFDFPAAAAMILLYYKIGDNIADEKGFKRLGYRLLRLTFRRGHRKASAAYPAVESAASAYLAAQQQLEADGCGDLDRACEPTAKLLETLLAFCSDDPCDRRALARLGYCLGRFIYLLDAAADLPADLQSGGYNALRLSLPENVDPAAFARERVTPQLYLCLSEMQQSFEALDIQKCRDILGNILYLGLEETMKKELSA